MGILIEGYKLGGGTGSLVVNIYAQLGRQPIATQRKKIGGALTEDNANEWVYETIYVATAHGSCDDQEHITVVRQGGVRTSQPVTGDIYALCYNDLKTKLEEEGYTITDA